MVILLIQLRGVDLSLQITENLSKIKYEIFLKSYLLKILLEVHTICSIREKKKGSGKVLVLSLKVQVEQ